MRHALRLAILAILVPGCSDLTSPAAVTTTVVPFEATDRQTAQVGMALPAPLKVRVTYGGAAKEGVTVAWHASAGSIDPGLGVTDAEGVASAVWTLGETPGPMTATMTVAGAQGSPLTFNATAVPSAPIATAIPTSDGQTAVVGTALPQPLRVLVQLHGAPQAGVRIHWQPSGGAISPEESVSDGDGIASSTWTLSTAAGPTTATAAIVGAGDPALTFHATGVAGPGMFIEPLRGDGQSVPANRHQFGSLAVRVTDQYGNAAGRQAVVTWTVERGPVVFVTSEGTTDGAGQSLASLEPSGTEGDAVVKATLPGGSASVSFGLTVLPPLYRVVIDNYVFRSDQNGSRTPAVDTIPAGATIEWLVDPFDYDHHRIVAVGSPSFPDAEIPYYGWVVRRTFVTPGTYEYADFYYPEDRGTLVVR
jgi:hypothetical protein